MRPEFRADLADVLRGAAPLYLSTLALTAGALVGTAVLGRFGTAPLAAFAVANAVYFPASAAVTGAVRGVMPFVTSRAEDRDGLRVVLADGTWLAFLTGALGALAVLAVPLLARAGGVPAEVAAELGLYPLLLAASLLVTAVGAMASAALVGLRRGTVVMRAGLLGAGVTVTLSPLLVLGPGPLPALGLTGAGLATLAAATASAAGCLTGLCRVLGMPVTRMLRGRPEPRRLVELARVGLPLAGTVLVKFAGLGVVAFAAARVGTDSAAAHSIAIALANLAFVAAVAVGQAVVPLVARRAADGDLYRVRSAVRAGLLVAVVVLGTVCALVVGGRETVLTAFTADTAVRAEVLALVPLLAVVVLADGTQAIGGFGLTGLKRTTPSLFAFLTAYGLLALSAPAVAATFGLAGLWTALAAANLLLVAGQLGAFALRSREVCAAARQAGEPDREAGARPG